MSSFKYMNYVSLGYFCGIANDLEKLGLRNQSYPFDWGISELSKVIYALEHQFNDFMEYNNMSQSVNFREHYRDDKYDFYFFHDFNKYKSFDEQYNSVKKKYERRINRLLENIKTPTLFIRYISTESMDENGNAVELKWIEENYNYIVKVLKSYNKDNQIIFVGDETLHSEQIKIYNVKKDIGDTVARSPIYCNNELYLFFERVEFPNKENNIQRYKDKQKKENKLKERIKRKMINFLYPKIYKEYNYYKVYNIPNR